MWSSRRPIIFFPLSIKKVIESTWSLFLKTIHGFYKALYLSRLHSQSLRAIERKRCFVILRSICVPRSAASPISSVNLNRWIATAYSSTRFRSSMQAFSLPARLWFPVRIHLNMISARSDGTCIVNEMIMSTVVETEDARHKKYYLENYSQLFL